MSSGTSKHWKIRRNKSENEGHISANKTPSYNPLHEHVNISSIILHPGISKYIDETQYYKVLPDFSTIKPTILEQSDKEYIDPEREIKGVMTDFVVNEFVKTQNQIFEFTKLVYGTFEKHIKTYIETNNLKLENRAIGDPGSIFFVYKGGNTMRLVFNTSLDRLPGEVYDVLHSYYANDFKRSDADFSIYIDPKLSNFDKIYGDMTTLSYHLQNEIRNKFNESPEKYFDYFNRNDEIKKNTLKMYLDKLNNTESVKDPANTDYYDVEFVRLVFDGLDYKSEKYESNTASDIDKLNISAKKDLRIQQYGSKQSALITLSNEPDNLYISSNETLTFTKGNLHIKFNLVRTKINFVAYGVRKNNQVLKRYSIGGELIDVSIQHKDNTTNEHFFSDLPNLIGKYTLTNDITNDKFEFNSYSVKYLANDLENMLFVQNIYPWEDLKYAKRIRRLFFMYFFDLLIKLGDNNVRLQYVNDFETYIYNQYNTLSTTQDVSIQHIDNITTNPKYLELVSKSSNFLISFFIKNLNNVAKLSFGDSDIEIRKIKIEKFGEFMKIFGENLVIMKDAFNHLNNYINKKGRINVKDDIYAITKTSELAGGSRDNYKQKYIKYRNKYLSLKKL